MNIFSSYKGIISRILVLSILTITLVFATVFPQPTNAFSIRIPYFNGLFNIEEAVAFESQFPQIDDIEPRRTIWVTMTAYSSDVGQTDNTPCIPADWTYDLCKNYEESGAQDTIATNFLPLGTKVKFPGLYGNKIFTVRDRMNARYGYGRGDIWMPSRQEAITFGAKRIQMEIYYK